MGNPDDGNGCGRMRKKWNARLLRNNFLFLLKPEIISQMEFLYIHIPFCRKKCFYCSFAVFVAQDQWIDPYLECLEMEKEFKPYGKLKTVYLGGGTPSLLHKDQMMRLFRVLRADFMWGPQTEVTIEEDFV